MAGVSHSIALKSNGILYGWGTDLTGVLGNGLIFSRQSPIVAGYSFIRPSPIQIGSSLWNSTTAGYFGTVAIRSDNKLFVWGSNGTGTLGDNTTTSTYSPVQVGTSSWNKASIGQEHILAIKQ